MRVFKRLIKKILSIRFLSPVFAWVSRNNPLVSLPLRRILAGIVPVSVSTVSTTLPNGRPLRLYHNSLNNVTKPIFWNIGYEKETSDFFFRKCQTTGTVIDVGANIGYYSILAALANPRLKIVAFEPVPSLYLELVKNITLNGLLDQIQPLQKAVSERTGETSIYIPYNGVLAESSTLRGFRNDADEVKCGGVALDDFVAEMKIEDLTLIKIDVEGAEHLVFRGMKNILKTTKPDIICEVLPGRFREETERLLMGFGYAFSWIKPNQLVPRTRISGDPEYQYLNYYFSQKI